MLLLPERIVGQPDLSGAQLKSHVLPGRKGGLQAGKPAILEVCIATHELNLQDMIVSTEGLAIRSQLCAQARNCSLICPRGVHGTPALQNQMIHRSILGKQHVAPFVPSRCATCCMQTIEYSLQWLLH